jgi:hypothetical protein
MDLSSHDEQARFELPDDRPGRPDRPPLVDRAEDTEGGRRQTIELPRLPRRSDRRERRPEAPMNEGGLSVEELRRENVRSILQLRENREDRAALRMAPPRRRERLAGDQADDARQSLVLLEEESLRTERREDPVRRRFHGEIDTFCIQLFNSTRIMWIVVFPMFSAQCVSGSR